MGAFSTINEMLKRPNPYSLIKEQNSFFGLLSNRLNSLFIEIEGESLGVGVKLQEFSLRSKELSEMTSTATKLTSGTDINTAIDGLRGQLSQMSQYLDFSQKKSDGSISKLLHILDVNKELVPIFNSFKKISQTLQFLSISAQVESSHVGEGGIGFNAFTNDIKELAKIIDVKTEGILKNSESLTLQIQNVLDRAKELLKTQQSTSVDILKDAQSNLESLIDLNNKSSRISAQLEERSLDIHQNIGEVVTSAQFHDISRQQIEHVGEAMGEVHRRLDEARHANGSFSRSQKKELVCWVGGVCEHQLSQLPNIRDEFVDAVCRIIDSLKEIGLNVNAMVGELQDMGHSAYGADTSFLSKIEEGIKTIIESLSEDSRIGNEISTSVSKTVDSMVVFVNDIKEIGSKIKLIALNAQINAANVGEHGNTLGIIAEAIQELSIETKEQTSTLLDKLGTITDDTKTFQGVAKSSLASEGDKVKDMVNVLEKLLDTIRSINTEFMALLSNLDKSGQVLGREIEDVANKIKFHRKVSDTVDDATTKLDVIVLKLKRTTPPRIKSGKKQEIKVIETSKPMRRELKAPQSTISDETKVLARINSDGGDNKTLERFFGDNVELF